MQINNYLFLNWFIDIGKPVLPFTASVLFLFVLGYIGYQLFINKTSNEIVNSEFALVSEDRALAPYDFIKNRIYIFKPDFSLKYAEPMMITLFKDENEYLNFAIHCIDSNKYKIGYVSDFVFEDSLGFNKSFTWEYYRFDGYSDSARVEMFLVQQNARVRFMCHVLNSDRTQNTYIGEQIFEFMNESLKI